uniref:transcriptional coactivator YAP1-like n=1 Tax=Styela clava TaxID=7725 RepID=UPI00193AC913|nr:transcriptional coactivator YAP1-like [Styela clava]
MSMSNMEEEENDPEIQTTITQGHSGHSQILHVRQDSANELDQLFNVALDPNKKTKSLPMKYRKLPKSFFQQPDRPRHVPMHAHSRSMGGLVSTPVNHSRSSSTDSSASHQSGLNLSSNNLPQQSQTHMNNNIGPRSGNFTPGPMQHSPFQNSPSHLALQQPQIAHSRSKSSPASLQIANANMQMKIQQPSNHIEIPPDMPLPQGWEFARTQDGQTYFMNHTNRTTTWVDPRIDVIKEQQERVNANNMQAVNHQQSQMHINSVQQPEQLVVQQPLPSGWEQATTPQGEIYFINHETRTTSWLDPRLQGMNLGGQSQMNAQIQQQLHKMNQLDISSPPPPNSHQQRSAPGSQMLFSKLTKEKEMIMKMRQQQMLKQTGMDPFLGSNSSCHEREPSRESGVSGMGSNFNLPRTPNEYLGSVEEEMDTDGGNHNQQDMNQQQSCMATSQQGRQQHVQRGNAHQQQQAQHFPDFLDSLPASSVDFSNEGNHPQSNALDSDELVPSISETLSPDFIHDVESMLNPVVKSENMDSMTWL